MKKEVKEELKRLLKEYGYKKDNYDDDVDDFCWWSISRYKVLSEDFIKEFQYKLDWYEISFHQPLSKYFIIKFQDKLDLDLLLKYKKITPEFYNKLKPVSRYELLDFS